MDTQDPNNTTPAADQLDDVEAHGLKEVAAGIGAAAVLGGAGAGMALASSSDVMPISPHKVVTQATKTERQALNTLKNKPTPPPNPSQTNNARTPTPGLPKVHLPHGRMGNAPEAKSPDAGAVVQKVVKKAQKKAADEVRAVQQATKELPPIR